MFSWISTNTSMSAKRFTTLRVSGRLSAPEIDSASGRLELPATSLIRGGVWPPELLRASKGMALCSLLAAATGFLKAPDLERTPRREPFLPRIEGPKTLQSHSRPKQLRI